jgi:isoamyl acetate esterase
MAPSTIRISDQWHGMKVVPVSHRDQLQAFLDGLDFEWLQCRAGSFLGAKCELRRDVFAVGREHIVFELLSPNAAAVARIQKPLFSESSGPDRNTGPSAKDITDEVRTIQYVSNNTTIPVPHVFEYDVDPGNPLGAPYILMEEMPGHLVGHLKIAGPYVRHVYAQIAGIVLQLSKLHFPRIGLICQAECVFEDFHRLNAFKSAKDFYIARAEHFYSQQIERSDVNWTTLAWLYLQAIPLICKPDLDNGPFPLRHPDLNNLNLLFDDEYNIVGLIDWTLTQAVAWQSFVVPPNQFDSLCYPGNRKVYLDIFEEVERSQDPEIPLTKLMRNCEIAELLESYHGWAAFVEWRALGLARLVFGKEITWAGVVEKYRKATQG